MRCSTELGPDLVLTQELCRVCAVAYPTVLEAARTAGGDEGPMVVSLEPHSVADVFATIELVARLAGVPGAGERARRRPAATAGRGRAAVTAGALALVEWLDPLFTPGTGCRSRSSWPEGDR